MGEATTEQEKEPNYYISHKLVLLGEVAVGKSSIAQRFVNGKFTNSHQATIGALFLTKKIQLNDSLIQFDIWDTAGQERYHALTPMYYKNAKAAIIVFDVTNYSSFERAKKWVTELMEKATPGIIIVLCGNKIDLDNRQIQKEEAETYSKEIGSFYIEVSAKQNLNVAELFTQLAERMPKVKPEDNGVITLDNNDTKKDERKGCYGYSCY